MERVEAVVASGPAVDTEERPGPFGLTPEEVRHAFERTQGRPVGTPRYEAFARELEGVALRRWVRVEFRAIPLAHAYGRLMWHTRIMKAALQHALAFVRAHVPNTDVRPGLGLVADFDNEFPGDDA